MRDALRLLLIVLAPWVTAAVLAVVLSAPELPCDCLTDTDCAEHCGGDGSPE